MTLDVQLWTMVSMALCGFYLGVAFDTYNRFARRWQHKRLLTYSLAIIFWLLQASIVFIVLYKVNYGELRIYVFLACMLGFSVYQLIAATLYRQLLEGIIKLVRSLLQFISKVVQLIVLNPLLFIIRSILSVVNFIGQIILTIIKGLLFPFRHLAIKFYRLLQNKIKKTFDKIPVLYSIIEFIYSKIRLIMSLLRR